MEKVRVDKTQLKIKQRLKKENKEKKSNDMAQRIIFISRKGKEKKVKLLTRSNVTTRSMIHQWSYGFRLRIHLDSTLLNVSIFLSFVKGVGCD